MTSIIKYFTHSTNSKRFCKFKSDYFSCIDHYVSIRQKSMTMDSLKVTFEVSKKLMQLFRKRNYTFRYTWTWYFQNKFITKTFTKRF